MNWSSKVHTPPLGAPIERGIQRAELREASPSNASPSKDMSDPGVTAVTAARKTGLFSFEATNPAIRLLQKAMKYTALEAIHNRTERERRPGESFYAALLRLMRVSWSVSDIDLARIPKTGPCVIVANHPFGMIEGTTIGTLLESVRPDVRIMANSVLANFPRVAERCILVNPFGGEGSNKENRQGLRRCLEWLRAGGLLVVFPSGEVASLDVRRRVITDPPWNTNVIRLLSLAKAPVVPFFVEGRNSVTFQIAGLLHPRLRTLLLAHEFFNKQGKTLVIRIGNLISPKKLESFSTDEERTDYLRRKTYVLANRQEPKPPLPFLLVPLKEKLAKSLKGEQEQVVSQTDPVLMEREIEALGPGALLDTQGDNQVYLAEANRVPNVVREIGRLREVTFRQTGEGTGKSIDLDEFDTFYQHLFIWNTSAREIVGAYRLGQTDRILSSFGIKGFYTATLFSYQRNFLERLNPALEMGRSFVRLEYQRSYGPLLLLWRGIGAYVARHPKYKILFGPVSISNDYHPNSRQLIVTFLKEYCRAEDLERLVRARSPFRTRPIHGWEGMTEDGIAWDIEELSALIADIETDQKGVPVLLKQYLKLGGRLLGFNIDPNFSNALDGLIVVDLVKTDQRLLDRYMGKAGASAFLAYHQGELAEAR
jgi:putative hemolysin